MIAMMVTKAWPAPHVKQPDQKSLPLGYSGMSKWPVPLTGRQKIIMVMIAHDDVVVQGPWSGHVAGHTFSDRGGSSHPRA
jgi:hypothetical protein